MARPPRSRSTIPPTTAHSYSPSTTAATSPTSGCAGATARPLSAPACGAFASTTFVTPSDRSRSAGPTSSKSRPGWAMRTSRRPCGTCTTATARMLPRASTRRSRREQTTERLRRPVSNRASGGGQCDSTEPPRLIDHKALNLGAPGLVVHSRALRRFAIPSVPRRSPQFGAPIGARHPPPDRVSAITATRGRLRPHETLRKSDLARWQPDCSGAYESRVRHADATRQAAGRPPTGTAAHHCRSLPSARPHASAPPGRVFFRATPPPGGYGASDAAGEGGGGAAFRSGDIGLRSHPRSWAERAYPDNLIHYNKLDRGGHFAAWEQPQLFTDELRAGFRSLRA